MHESPHDVDWNAARLEAGFRSAKWSAWGSLVAALLAVTLLAVAAVMEKFLGHGSPTLRKVLIGLLYPSPFLLLMSLIYGLIALKSARRFGPSPIRPLAIAGLAISGPLCGLGALFAFSVLSWFATASGWE